MRLPRLLPLVAATALLGGCAGSRPAGAPPVGRPADVYPGFDTWGYPGDEALRVWREASPYRWVGYYLPSPCHRDTSWAGRRAALERMGWGVAVLYVGQQAFEGAPPPDDSTGGPVLCSRTLLTEAQGARDASDAAARAEAEGFPAGTAVFLNVERVDVLAPELAAYVRAWTAGLLRDGRFVPGLYAHRANADALFALALAEHQRAGRAARPPVWVAGGDGFTLEAAPVASGLPYADVWQGVLDAERTWGGVTLTVDENVARRPSPSGGAP